MSYANSGVRRLVLAAVGAAGLLAGGQAAQANIDLELRLLNSPTVGQIAEIALFAVSDDDSDQDLRGIEAIIGWDPAVLRLEGHVDPCCGLPNDDPPPQFLPFYALSTIAFPDPFGTNEADPPADGDAFYQMLQFPSEVTATPEGVLITTFEFTVLVEAATTVAILPTSPHGIASTCVYDPVLPNTCITGELLSTQVSFGDPCAGDPNDSDSDGFADSCDNCPDEPNAGQDDGDIDGIGDSCDNCPDNANSNQDDGDNDGFGDACDICKGGDDSIDSDLDGVPDACDLCPFDANDDSDGDGVCDSFDICEGFDDNANADGDALPDGCDECPNDAENDADEDDVCGDEDNCPNDANPDQADNDDDGLGNICETCPADTDNSGVVDVDDLIRVIAGWNSSGLFNNSDVNFDGIVDVDDLLGVIGAWGTCP